MHKEFLTLQDVEWHPKLDSKDDLKSPDVIKALRKERIDKSTNFYELRDALIDYLREWEIYDEKKIGMSFFDVIDWAYARVKANKAGLNDVWIKTRKKKVSLNFPPQKEQMKITKLLKPAPVPDLTGEMKHLICKAAFDILLELSNKV